MATVLSLSRSLPPFAPRHVAASLTDHQSRQRHFVLGGSTAFGWPRSPKEIGSRQIGNHGRLVRGRRRSVLDRKVGSGQACDRRNSLERQLVIANADLRIIWPIGNLQDCLSGPGRVVKFRHAPTRCSSNSAGLRASPAGPVVCWGCGRRPTTLFEEQGTIVERISLEDRIK